MSIPDVDPPTESNPSSADTDWIGKWCVGLYDDVLYPGIVQGVDDEDFAVKVMHKIGQYRYFFTLLPNNITKLFAKYKSLLRWVVGTFNYQLQKPIMNTCSSFDSKCYCDHVMRIFASVNNLKCLFFCGQPFWLKKLSVLFVVKMKIKFILALYHIGFYRISYENIRNNSKLFTGTHCHSRNALAFP